MRKILFYMLLAGMSTMTIAQSTYQPRLPHVYYPWWYENYMDTNTNLMSSIGIGGGDYTRYYVEEIDVYDHDISMNFTTLPAPWGWGVTELAMRIVIDSSMTVLGASVEQLNGIAWHYYGTDLFPLPEYVRLYQSDNDSLILLAEKQLILDRMLNEDEYIRMQIDTRQAVDSIIDMNINWHRDTCYDEDLLKWIPATDYYFDSPQIVHDTFYLAITYNNLLKYWEPRFEGDYCLYDLRGPEILALRDGISKWGCHPPLHQFPAFAYKTKLRNRITQEDLPGWQDTMWNYFACVLPIINYDSPILKCDTATKLCLVSQNEDSFTFSWEVMGTPPDSWQFCYAPVGVEPSQGTTVNCNTTTVTITTDTNVSYYAYVRSYCDQISRYSEWSSGVHFGAPINDPNNPDNITPVDTLTIMVPNPASDRLIFRSAFEMQRIEVFALDGRKVMEFPISNHDYVADISNLPAGSYLVKIFSQAGSTTKKLVVR